MSSWEEKIIDAFISHYFASTRDASDGPQILRLRTSTFFTNFDTANTDEKVSYLEAAESLERNGIVTLTWEKRNKGERLRTISCENFTALFAKAKRPFPKTEAATIRAMVGDKAAILKERLETVNGNDHELEQHTAAQANSNQLQHVIALLEFCALHFGPREINQGMNTHIMSDFVQLLEFIASPEQMEHITTRALSILLYRDSKRLETVLTVSKPLVVRAEKTAAIPDFSFLERSFPDTMISGKIIIEYKGEKTPLLNVTGRILGLPLEHTELIERITLLSSPQSKIGEKTVLTIENKETFYALSSQASAITENIFLQFDCYLYIGGYFNRAAAALIKALSASGFAFYHAGDLDPDGILILQQIQDTAQRPVTPLRMDAATFDQYLPWARTLPNPMRGQLKKITDETKAIPGLTDLLHRIEETGLGVEQEIINYRE